MTQKLYWLGNAAKTKIVGEVLQQIARNPAQRVVIFDYGCGAGGDWAAILSDHPQIELIGYDPCAADVAAARARLRDHAAQLYTLKELEPLTFRADFIVSFSVFEHVYERRLYLETAKKHLADDGVFYLNYDDGHFRQALDLGALRSWPRQLREWLHNVTAGLWAKLGKTHLFQQRVLRADVDQMLAETGFQIGEVFYSNLSDFKSLCKTLPEERRAEFARFWLHVENELNEHFLCSGTRETLGDVVNLWQLMGSRTLVLRHASSTEVAGAGAA
jgi:SAM-dependent methyltransferase